MEKPDEKELKDSGYPLGFYHFNDWQDEEYFQQMCAEQRLRKRNKRGYWETEWHKLRERNEVLDINVYIMACYERLGLDRMQEEHWIDLEIQLGKNILPDGTPVGDTVAPKPVAKKQPGGRIKRRPSNFMNKG